MAPSSVMAASSRQRLRRPGRWNAPDTAHQPRSVRPCEPCAGPGHHRVVDDLRIVVTRGGERPPGVNRPVDSRAGDKMAGDEDPGLQALIVINGVTEMDRWGGFALGPNDLLNPDMPLIPPADGSSISKAVQRCGCGVVGCGNVTFTIRRAGEVIEWTDARDRDRRIAGIGPFRFDGVQYEAEVRRAHRERDWETRAERIARLLTYACQDERDARPLSFGWASGCGGHVTVYVREMYRNPRAGQTTELPDGTLLHEREEDWTNHLGYFAIPDLADEAAVQAIRKQMRSVPAARWRRPPNWPYG